MDGNTTNPFATDAQQQVSNTLVPTDEIIERADPIALSIPDSELKEFAKKRREASMKFFEDKYNLTKRREKNETYLFGRQVESLESGGKLKDYETRSADNALYEIEASLKPLAMSRLPDIIVTPGSEDIEKQKTADEVTIAIDDTLKKREQREVLGLAFKHLPVYLTAVIKTRWDSEKGKYGDYRFDVIHPEYIVVDHTCTTRNPDDMGFIAQLVPQTLQEGLMKFPDKKEELLEALKIKSYLAGEEITQAELATEIRVWETWFDWYKRDEGESQDEPELLEGEAVNKEEMKKQSILEPGITWKRISGVMWDCQGVLLDKRLDPNYDHEGETKLMAYEDASLEDTKFEVDPQRLAMGQLLGMPTPEVNEEQVYHNYFERPHKPYYFFGYDQWGKVYLDETSRLEQNIRNQENLDDQNRTMLDQLKTRIKHIWSKDGGLDKASIQKLDMSDPKMDALVDGNPNEVHKAIMPERPDQAQFNNLEGTRQRMYAISGSTAVRGQIQSDTATTNQIAREADFTRTDDLVEDTINSASEWIANWQLQWIKLRYTENHLRQILGDKGKLTYIKLRRDMISDGMEVMIKASSTDKLKAQRNAMQTAQLGAPFSNPLDFFRDMDMHDPEGRTERGIIFAIDPNAYYAKYVLGMENGQQMAQAIAPQPQQPTPQGGGQPAPQPQNPTPEDTGSVPSAPPVTAPEGSPRGI